MSRRDFYRTRKRNSMNNHNRLPGRYGPASCALCGHVPSCGLASVYVEGVNVWLCHADDHSCYDRWTVYDERPARDVEVS